MAAWLLLQLLTSVRTGTGGRLKAPSTKQNKIQMSCFFFLFFLAAPLGVEIAGD